MILGIYGASGLGKEFCDNAETINEEKHCWEEIVFVDDDPEKQEMDIMGKRIFTFQGLIKQFTKDSLQFIIAIGEPSTKDKVSNMLIMSGCEITCLIPSEAKVHYGATYGYGLVVEGPNSCAVPPDSHFGNNVLIQGRAVMGHDIELGDNVVISSLTFIGGNTKIGRNTYIAPCACLRNGITIGENCVIGMGSVVTKDVPDNSVAYGNPAKVVKTVEGTNKVFSK